ncbi:hypothetical protein D3C75_708600 [compost metagenome]
MPEQVRAQIIYDPLPDNIRIFNPVDPRDPLNQIEQNHRGSQRVQKCQTGTSRLGRNRLIDGHTRQVRDRQLRNRAENHQHRHERQHLPCVRLHITEQPGELLPIECLVDDVIVFVDEPLVKRLLLGCALLHCCSFPLLLVSF